MKSRTGPLEAFQNSPFILHMLQIINIDLSMISYTLLYPVCDDVIASHIINVII